MQTKQTKKGEPITKQHGLSKVVEQLQVLEFTQVLIVLEVPVTEREV